MDSSFPEALLIACLTSTDWLTASCQSPGESDTHVHSASCYGRLPVLDDANYSTMGSPACGSTLLQSKQEEGSSRKDERRPLRVINGVKGESSITGSTRRNGILKINKLIIIIIKRGSSQNDERRPFCIISGVKGERRSTGYIHGIL